jgi:hypothetical protein
MKIRLNRAILNEVSLNATSIIETKVSRDVPDSDIPETHTEMMDSGSEIFEASDGGFYVIKE